MRRALVLSAVLSALAWPAVAQTAAPATPAPAIAAPAADGRTLADLRADLKALAAAVGSKRATLADPALAERTTGYVVGGISPLGTVTTLPTLIDASVEHLDAVTVSAGQRGLSAKLAPGDLAALANASFAPISSP